MKIISIAAKLVRAALALTLVLKMSYFLYK